jgi:hypothetical protein
MDLTMIEEGNPDEIDGLINFQKLSMIYQVIEKVQRYQQVLLMLERERDIHLILI